MILALIGYLDSTIIDTEICVFCDVARHPCHRHQKEWSLSLGSEQ